MPNFELRWFKPKEESSGSDYLKLQYRVKYDPTMRAGARTNINAGLMTGFNPELIWSEWKSVPLVVEE